ncbi:kinase-like domain-containing protein [Gorgonomyces haynaldii]|nr:kinase-like domain-containing protein [Gorgonomyces haynaldii]
MVRILKQGFDDSRGDLYLTKHDHIAYRYEILSLLGKGSFGQVIKCFDHKRKTHVALKIIRNKTRFEKQGLVEVKVLNKLADADHSHSNCLVHVLSNFFFRGHLCFTFELLGINLYEWLKAGNFRGVHLGVVQRLSYQMLQCLQLLERLSIIHCDLKPENILLIPPDFDPLKKTYDIKVIDFGSSCYESERLYTYVQSRFYRSPEVILGAPYSTAIDIWSFGCILAEMLMGYPLFPGENEQEQLHCIMELRGLPPSSFVSKGTRASVFFDANGSPRPFTNTKGKRRRPGTKTLGSVLKCSDMAFLDFLDKCLEWEPEKRLKPLEALQHPFITGERFIPKPVHPTSASSRSNRTVDAEGLTASSSKYIPQVNSDYMTPLSANTLQRYGQARAAYYGTEYTGKSLPNVFPTRKSTDAPRTLDKAKSFGYRPPQQTDPDDVLPPITNASPQRTKRLSLGTFLRRKSPKDKRTSENVQ